MEIRGLQLFALALMIVAPSTAAAQEGPLRLTLDEAIARAEQNSLRVSELQARVDVAAAVEAGREAAGQPALALLGGYTRTNHVAEYTLPLQPFNPLYPDVPNNYRARVDLQWPIYTAGRQPALARAAGAEREAAGFDVAAARLDARLEAVRAFWALATASQTELVVQRALDTLDAHLRDLRSRLDQGLIPPNEVLTAEAQRSHQQLLAIEARNLRQVATADLRRVVGEDSGRAIEPVGVGDAPLPPPPAASFDIARDQRPERRALASRIAGARERETAAAASARPQVSVAAGYDYARPNPRIFPRVDDWNDSWDASVNVSWSLWDGGRRRAEQAEAVANTRVLTSRSADFDRQLAFEVEQRRLDLESSVAAIAATGDGVRAALEAQRVVGERFTAGVATNTDVLDAQTSLLQAELDRTRAIASARLAIARLDRVLGRP